MGDPEREPCPYRIFEDMGSAFLLGAWYDAIRRAQAASAYKTDVHARTK